MNGGFKETWLRPPTQCRHTSHVRPLVPAPEDTWTNGSFATLVVWQTMVYMAPNVAFAFLTLMICTGFESS